MPQIYAFERSEIFRLIFIPNIILHRLAIIQLVIVLSTFLIISLERRRDSKVGNHARVGANKGMPPGDLGDLDFYIGSKSLPDEKTPTDGIAGMRECSSNPFWCWMKRQAGRLEVRRHCRIG